MSQAFEKFRVETTPQMTVIDALRAALAPFEMQFRDDREARVVDALRLRLGQIERPRKSLSRRRRVAALS